MKKKIEAELRQIARAILDTTEYGSLTGLQDRARLLYEKLMLLDFVEDHFSEIKPTIGRAIDAIDTYGPDTPVAPAAPPIPSTPPVVEETAFAPVAPTTSRDVKEIPVEKPEIVIDKINASISEDMFVPASPEEINAILRGDHPSIDTSRYQKNDKEWTAPIPVETTTQSEPSFQPKENTEESDKNTELSATEKSDTHTLNTSETIGTKSKSLNDRLSKTISIGLNDRLAFIRYLFDGNATDYNRVLSQLNTINSWEEAQQFINTMVKPDHQQWEGKEEYEQRFMQIVENRFA